MPVNVDASASFRGMRFSGCTRDEFSRTLLHNWFTQFGLHNLLQIAVERGTIPLFNESESA
jgi:hypothetical protein